MYYFFKNELKDIFISGIINKECHNLRKKIICEMKTLKLEDLFIGSKIAPLKFNELKKILGFFEQRAHNKQKCLEPTETIKTIENSIAEAPG